MINTHTFHCIELKDCMIHAEWLFDVELD